MLCFLHRLLPKNADLLAGFITKAVEKRKGADKPAIVLLFSDGAEVPFYLDRHPKAKAELAHVFLRGNAEVRIMPYD